MTSAPPPSHRHPGPPPQRPEVPEGITPPPGLPPIAPPVGGSRDGWPAFLWWTPFVAGLCAVVVAGIGFAIIGGLVDVLGGDVDFEDPPTGVVVGATLVQDLALIGCAVLFAMLGGGRVRPVDFGLRRVRPGPAIGWAFAAFLSFYAFTLVYTVALGISEQDDLARQLGADESTANLVAVGLLVVVAAPLGEEFFFRGFMFPALGRRLGLAAAAVITGAVFGVIHAGGTKAVFIVPLMVFGILLCLLYRRTGSLLPCIGLHAVNNALALGVTLDWQAWQVLLGVVVAPLLALAVAVPLSERAPRPGWAR